MKIRCIHSCAILLVYLTCSLPCFAKYTSLSNFQQTQHKIIAEDIYNYLDEFLGNTSLSNIAQFKIKLKSLEIENSSSDIQLAKVIALCNLGFYESKSGQLYNAIDSYKEGWQIYNNNKLLGYDIINSCGIPLGNLYTQTNAYEEAQRTIEQYILIAEEDKNSELVTSGIINLSTVLQSQGKYKEAAYLLQKTLVLKPQNPDLWMNLASASYTLGDQEKALQQVNRALLLHSKMANAFKLKALIYADNGQFEKAEELIKKLIKTLENHHQGNARDLAKAYLTLAEIQLADDMLSPNGNKKFLKALHTTYSLLIPSYKNEQEYPRKNQLYGENTLLDALELHAHFYEKIQRNKQAIQLLESAFLVVDRLNNKELLQSSRLLQQTGEKQRCELYLDLIYQQLQLAKDSDLIDKALTAVDRVKSKIATDNFTRKQLAISNLENESLNRLKELEENQASLNNKLHYAKRSASISDNQYLELLKASEQNHNTLLQEYSELVKDKKQAKTIITDSVIAKTFRKGETYLNYFVGKKHTYQFIINGKNAAMHRLTQNEDEQQLLIETCQEFNKLFASSGVILNNPDNYSKIAYKLYRLLSVPDSNHLVISPDGIFNFIPFDALLTQEDNSIQFGMKPYLIKKGQLSFTSSTTLYLSKDKALSKTPSILGLFPVFDQTNRALTYSLQEADVINKHFDMYPLFQKLATQDTFLSKSEHYTILHLSTHASGGSFTSPASLSFYDKDIPVELLYGQHLSPDLVVLSACETGVGKIIKGEGALSLARGFHYAGAKNILFSQWKVNDLSTAILMGYYYKNLKETQSRNFSLHLAKLNYLSDSNVKDIQKSPYYWASFTYYGTTDAPQVSTSYLWVWGLAIIVLFLIVLILKKYAFTSRVSSF